jgi:hypothetical protein
LSKSFLVYDRDQGNLCRNDRINPCLRVSLAPENSYDNAGDGCRSSPWCSIVEQGVLCSALGSFESEKHLGFTPTDVRPNNNWVPFSRVVALPAFHSGRKNYDLDTNRWNSATG